MSESCSKSRLIAGTIIHNALENWSDFLWGEIQAWQLAINFMGLSAEITTVFGRSGYIIQGSDANKATEFIAEVRKNVVVYNWRHHFDNPGEFDKEVAQVEAYLKKYSKIKSK